MRFADLPLFHHFRFPPCLPHNPIHHSHKIKTSRRRLIRAQSHNAPKAPPLFTRNTERIFERMNDNQNAFVTRSTSRVLSEPGGKSSMGFLFGGGSNRTPTNAPKATVADSAKKAEKSPQRPAGVVASPPPPGGINSNNSKEEETAISAAARIKAKNEAQHFSLFSPTGSGGGATKDVSSNSFASASSTNSYNVITDRSTSRVLRPPGGHSSIKLG